VTGQIVLGLFGGGRLYPESGPVGCAAGAVCDLPGERGGVIGHKRTYRRLCCEPGRLGVARTSGP
jgi:hypothetical protein